MQLSMTFSDFPEAQHSLILQRVLGKGKYTVYHAKSASGADFALKVFPKSSGASYHYVKEKQFLTKLSHSHIINYVPILNHSLPHDILATEFTPNGDAFDFVAKGGMYNEKIIRTYFHQLIEGIEFLHENGVAHLDIKLENLLLDRNFDLKILDFDQAQSTTDKELTSGGTQGYRAPEILNRKAKNLKALDIYSVGVVLYAFKTGMMPFNESKNDNSVSRTAKYEMFDQEKEIFWRGKEIDLGMRLSQDFKDLLSGMWKSDAKERFTINDIKRSNWYNGEVYSKEELRSEVSMILDELQYN
jgi:serine/threonine protein kinase